MAIYLLVGIIFGMMLMYIVGVLLVEHEGKAKDENKGEWKPELFWFRCNQCGGPSVSHYDYCPHCGCKMKEDYNG